MGGLGFLRRLYLCKWTASVQHYFSSWICVINQEPPQSTAIRSMCCRTEKCEPRTGALKKGKEGTNTYDVCGIKFYCSYSVIVELVQRSSAVWVMKFVSWLGYRVFSSPPPEGRNWKSPTDLHNRQNNRSLYHVVKSLMFRVIYVMRTKEIPNFTLKF